MTSTASERGWNTVHQHGFWAPCVQERDGAFRWFVPVESGHASFVSHLPLTLEDVTVLRSSQRRAILLLSALWSRLQMRTLTDEIFRREADAILHGDAARLGAAMDAANALSPGSPQTTARAFGLDVSGGWTPGAPKRDETDLVIESLGAQGDGRVRVGDNLISIALTLPGERVRARIHGDRGELVQLIDPSPDRVPPPCPSFGRCGGCALQHLEKSVYTNFKRDLIVKALKARGLSPPVAEAWITPQNSRRRAVFSAARRGKSIGLGFHARKSHDLIDIETCDVVRPALTGGLMFLRYLAQRLAPQTGVLSLHVTETPAGLDLVVTGVDRGVAQLVRMELAAEALRQNFARVTIEGAEAITSRPPKLPAGKAEMNFPPGGFLQASSEAEQEMARLALAHLADCKSVADIFCGSGTFALRLAEGRKVYGVDGQADAIAALKSSAAAAGLKGVSAEVRDLFRDPLRTDDLKRFDGVLIDPPRAGATAQSTELARARVPRLVYVSCDPATMARDLRALVDGGYAIKTVYPIDQFLWSAHVEAVALLERAA